MLKRMIGIHAIQAACVTPSNIHTWPTVIFLDEPPCLLPFGVAHDS
jgi:hypothetical protein